MTLYGTYVLTSSLGKIADSLETEEKFISQFISSQKAYKKKLMFVIGQVWGEFDAQLIMRGIGDTLKISQKSVIGIIGSANAGGKIKKNSRGKWEVVVSALKPHERLTPAQCKQIREYAKSLKCKQTNK